MGTIDLFNFKPNQVLIKKYRILKKIGSGWEGEVYLLKERKTGIERAAKFFYPKRNPNNKTVKFHAKKLNKLRDCSTIIKYFTQETIEIEEQEITFLVSEFVHGENLTSFIKKLPQKRLTSYQALHLLYSLACAIEEVHQKKEYHGDLHSDNIMIERFGIKFKLKIFDMFHYGKASNHMYQQDVVDIIRIVYEGLGGPKTYSKMPQYIKQLCLGNKSNLIRKKFKSASDLKKYIEELKIEPQSK